MTKKQDPSLAALIELKLAVINHHKGEVNEYLRSQIARDACYTSHNSVQFKSGQMADIRAELMDLAPAKGSEVIDVKVERKVEIYQRMEDELAELVERHNADLAVYSKVTGEKWTPRPKRNHKSDGLAVSDELARILAA